MYQTSNCACLRLVFTKFQVEQLSLSDILSHWQAGRIQGSIQFDMHERQKDHVLNAFLEDVARYDSGLPTKKGKLRKWVRNGDFNLVYDFAR